MLKCQVCVLCIGKFSVDFDKFLVDFGRFSVIINTHPWLNHSAVPVAPTELFVSAISYSTISMAPANFHGCSVVYVCTNTIVATFYLQALVVCSVAAGCHN